jgi:hypothetical protein
MLVVGQSLRAQPRTYDWLIAFYMPYDNDMSPHGQRILAQLKSAKLNGKVCATVQSDFSGPGGMTRYVFNAEVDSIHVSGESSATAATLQSYLQWARSTFPARNFAVVLLSHGGDMMEYGVDEYPKKPSRHWMPTDSIAHALRTANGNGPLPDLFFQQVCARATVENLYEFRNTARYSLASQSLIPTPGYYYAAVLEALEKESITDGAKLAELIVCNERPDMYYTLTLVDNSAWPAWIDSVEKYSEVVCSSIPGISVSDLKVLSYGGDVYWDMIATIQATTINNKVPASGNDLIQFTGSRLLTQFVSAAHPNIYSGLSLRTPFSKKQQPPLQIYGLPSFARWMKCLQKRD